jgi:hypothetical protein
VQGNSHRKTLMVSGMAQADVATLPADREITKFGESANQGVTRDYGQLLGSSRNDDAANQNIVGVGKFLAAAFHVF